MSLYRNQLPQLNGTLCITDGGLETDLCFNRGIALPEFAAYDLLRSPPGRHTLADYYRKYLDIARHYQLGLVLETPTWRANPDWGKKLGDATRDLVEFNRDAVALLEELRTAQGEGLPPVVISGCLGPRGDGYRPDALMSAQAAWDYHGLQVETFAGTAADMVSALTMNYVEEAIGVTLAAREHAMPVCISFTVETDGKLRGGTTLEQAVRQVDAATDGYPVYFMVNCAHPTHVDALFDRGGDWLARVKGVRGNASCKSHEELDNSTELDDGDPQAFGQQLNALRHASGALAVLGGCCGTDHRHIESICAQLDATAIRRSA